jgi:DNA replicative helicase MCM subunit Mcm2 (Cdc46/Mcm family)
LISNRSVNNWADFWRYEIGANIIPADTRNKRPKVDWKQHQNVPISEEQHKKWKLEDAFKDGMAIIAGKVWHNTAKQGLYLICVDLDNEKAIEEFCTRKGVKTPLSELAKQVIIEQHKDEPNKAHVIFYATHPFLKKSSDVSSFPTQIDRNEIPAIEVKGSGEHGLLFCTPSPHKNGSNYEIIEGGVFEPAVVDQLEAHIQEICEKYQIPYLCESGQSQSLNPIQELFKDDAKIFEGHNRHEALLRIMESLIKRNEAILDKNQIKRLAHEWNLIHCIPPLDEKEESKQWKDSMKFIEEHSRKRQLEQHRENERRQRELAELETDEEKRRQKEARSPLSVGAAAMLNDGSHYVRGLLSSLSELYKMVKTEELTCMVCHSTKTVVFDHPVSFATYSKEQFSHSTPCGWNFDTVGCKGFVESRPLYVNAVDSELRDPESLQDLTKVRLILFEDDTKDVALGEVVTIRGTVFIQQNRFKGKAFSTIFTQSIKYENREQSELSSLDIKAILRFKERFSSSLIDKLVSMTARRVIGYQDVKEGILMSAANAAPDHPERRRRIHIFIFGPPGLAKTALLMDSTKLVAKSSFDNAQTATGLSLLAMVEKEEDAYILRLGPIPRALLSAIDELNRMPFSDQEKMFGVMQEGFFTSNKFANRARIRSPTTIIASANPPIGTEPDPDGRIDLNELNIIPPVLDRFDLKFYVKSKTEENEIRELAYGMAEQQDRIVPDYSPFLRKFLIYSKRIKPKITDRAKSILTEAFVSMQKSNPEVTPRRQEALFNLARARARLQLKEIADEQDAYSVVKFYNKMVNDYEITTQAPEDPIDLAYKQCVQILSETVGGVTIPYTLEELLKKVCEGNEQIKRYLLSNSGRLLMRDNWRVKEIYEKLLLNSRITKVRKKPVVLQFVCDACDVCDEVQSQVNDQNAKNGRFDDLTQTETEREIADGSPN